MSDSKENSKKVHGFDIVKFDGKNDFTNWQTEVKDILISLKQIKALRGKPEKLPKDWTDEDWEEFDLEASSKIRLCLTREITHNYSSEKSAKELWEKLQSMYMKKDLCTHLALRKKLYTFSWVEGRPLSDHINAFTKITCAMEDIGIKLEDYEKAMILLCRLPQQFEATVDNLLTGKDEKTLKYDEVVVALQAKAIREAETTSSNEGQSLLVQSSRPIKGRSRSKTKKNKEEEECHWCYQVGHYKHECLKYLKKKDKKNDKDEASVAQVGEEVLEYLLGGDNSEVLTAETSEGVMNEWIFDTGASYHMCPARDNFSTYREVNGGTILMGDTGSLKTVGVGAIRFQMFDLAERTLTEVRHVPGLRKGLISLGVLEAAGCGFSGKDGFLTITWEDRVIMRGERHGNLYILKGKPLTGVVQKMVSQVDQKRYLQTQLWHKRLGHVDETGLTVLGKQGLFGRDKLCKLDYCEHCVFGKQCRTSYRKAKHRATWILDYVHSDIWGPSRVASLGGKRWFVTFIDDFSRRVWVYTMRQKGEVRDIFKKWKALVEKETGRAVKRVQHGIAKRVGVKGKSHDGSVAKRINHILWEKAQCMRSSAGLRKLW
ncbi:hypothetical protein ACHQM5_026075 [Ranunculus cassubicifolius]